jgi:Mg2+/Co2+ transporter CorC
MSIDSHKPHIHTSHSATRVEMSSCIIDSLYNYRKHHNLQESLKDINSHVQGIVSKYLDISDKLSKDVVIPASRFLVTNENTESQSIIESQGLKVHMQTP